MKTSLSRLPIGGLTPFASGETDASGSAADQTTPAGGCARGEGNQDSAPSPQRAERFVVWVDGFDVCRGSEFLCQEFVQRVLASDPYADVTIEPEGDA